MGGVASAFLVTAALVLPSSFAAAGNAASAGAHTTAAGGWGHVKCFGLLPITGARSYGQGCYGHDEPALDPISSVPGTGQDVTWTIKLPKSGSERSLLDVGPTFWVGATLSDSSSVAHRVFSELQFYPDSSLLPQTGSNINTACTKFGFNVQYTPGTWSVCDFTWGLYGATPSQWQETAAYVKVLDLNTNPNKPLYLHSGDVITVHVFNSHNKYNEAVQMITDVTTHQKGYMVMDSNATTGAGSAANPGKGDGPLTLPYSTNTTSNAMPWGVVDGTPFAFSWEIGHANIYTHGTQPECVPGQWDCYSYDTDPDGWGDFTPFQVLGVTFKVKSQVVMPSSFATNDSQGGISEDYSWCGGYQVPGSWTCSFPYYSYNPTSNSIMFGTTYKGTPMKWTWGKAPNQYAQHATCTGPLTSKYGFLYYCDTTLSPNPPVA